MKRFSRLISGRLTASFGAPYIRNDASMLEIAGLGPIGPAVGWSLGNRGAADVAPLFCDGRRADRGVGHGRAGTGRRGSADRGPVPPGASGPRLFRAGGGVPRRGPQRSESAGRPARSGGLRAREIAARGVPRTATSCGGKSFSTRRGPSSATSRPRTEPSESPEASVQRANLLVETRGHLALVQSIELDRRERRRRPRSSPKLGRLRPGLAGREATKFLSTELAKYPHFIPRTILVGSAQIGLKRPWWTLAILKEGVVDYEQGETYDPKDEGSEDYGQGPRAVRGYLQAVSDADGRSDRPDVAGQVLRRARRARSRARHLQGLLEHSTRITSGSSRSTWPTSR